MDAIVLAALAIIGDDPGARFAYFRRLLAVAREVGDKPAKVGGTATDPSLLM